MQSDLLRGAASVVTAALLFATMGAVVRVATAELPNETIVFLRNAFGLAVLLPWLWRRGLAGVKTACPGLHLFRTLTGLAAMYCFFYALAHLHLAEAVLFTYSAPLFIPFVASLWLAEPLGAGVVLAALTGFGGVLLILKPGAATLVPAAWAGVASGALAALAQVSVRRLAASEPATRIVFYFAVGSTLISAIPLAWGWRAPTLAGWGLMAAVGGLATAGQLFLTRGYGYAPAARVGVFNYTSVLFAAAIGWYAWGEHPDFLSLCGAILVVLAGVAAGRTGRKRKVTPEG